MMKKIILLSLGVLAAGQVFAQTAVCAGGVAQGTGTAPNIMYTTTANMFVVRPFPVRCSANVTAGSRETAVVFGVGALSIKGKSYFQGTSGGGAIAGQACTGMTCTAGMEDTGLSALVNAAT
jgi:hypothetical protein